MNKNRSSLAVLSACAILIAFFFAISTADSQQEPVTTIEMTAKKYDFAPAEIRVKKGTKVQLKITATDRDHGFAIDIRPEGADKFSPEGLRFTDPQPNWKLEKGQQRVIEFLALRSGTYEFRCSLFCGFGHRGMKGRLIVED